MTTSRSTTTKKMVRILCVQNAEKDAKEMKNAMFELYKAVMNASSEYSIYIEQKKFAEKNVSPDELVKCQSLFAKDFTDFKNKLNKAIRAFNQFDKDYRFHLAILGEGHSFVQEFAAVETSLNELKKYYEKDKPLYVGVKINQNIDIVKLPENISALEEPTCSAQLRK